MVAYSFQKQFVDPILTGAKRQTIRADRKRHARPGEELQLYTGMRTKHCKLIARVCCIEVDSIRIFFDGDRQPRIALPWAAMTESIPLSNIFARRDGFASWEEMRDFWRKHHPGVEEFNGVLIRWGEILA